MQVIHHNFILLHIFTNVHALHAKVVRAGVWTGNDRLYYPEAGYHPQ